MAPSPVLERRLLAPGEHLIHQGGPADCLYFIESGEVSVSVQGTTVATLGPGKAFGELALIDKSARSATVTAVGQAHCYLMPIWSFRPIVEEHPEMAWTLLESLAKLVRDIEARSS